MIGFVVRKKFLLYYRYFEDINIDRGLIFSIPNEHIDKFKPCLHKNECLEYKLITYRFLKTR